MTNSCSSMLFPPGFQLCVKWSIGGTELSGFAYPTAMPKETPSPITLNKKSRTGRSSSSKYRFSIIIVVHWQILRSKTILSRGPHLKMHESVRLIILSRLENESEAVLYIDGQTPIVDS
ncbi:unnamed protein product, partial [Prunus brigantina]